MVLRSVYTFTNKCSLCSYCMCNYLNFFLFDHLVSEKWYFIESLIYIHLTVDDVEPFIVLLWGTCLYIFLCLDVIEKLISRSSLYILEIDLISVMHEANVFSQSAACLRTFSIVSFNEHILQFNVVVCVNFFMIYIFGLLFNFSLPSS